MERKALLFLGGGVAALGAYALAKIVGAPVEPGTPICQEDPPGPQPGVPSGWRLYSGAVSGTGSSRARAALSMPFGWSDTFQDDDGSMLGVMVMWHCHEPGSGMTPVGWHKGATLFRVG